MRKKFQRWVTYIQDYQNVSTNAYIASCRRTALCSLTFPPCIVYETCSRRVAHLTTANRLRFWLEDTRTILCNTWHDKLPFDQPTRRLLTHSGRKASFILSFFLFFSRIYVQYSTVINGIRENKISGKNAGIENFTQFYY